MAQVAVGASIIIQQCANKERNQGGLAMDISKLPAWGNGHVKTDGMKAQVNPLEWSSRSTVLRLCNATGT